MPTRRALLSLAFLTACTRQSPWRALPFQRPAPSGDDPPADPYFVWMNAPEADSCIVSGVARGAGAGFRRWAADRFSLVFKPLPEGSWRARVRFDLHQRFLDELGPFTLNLSVNGRALASQTYSSPGDAELTAAAPPGLLKPGEPARIDVACDRVWISPNDGARLSVRLVAAGFVRQ